MRSCPRSSCGGSSSRPLPPRAARRSRSPGWTKFAALLLAPLWLSYGGTQNRVVRRGFAFGFVVATVAAFCVLLLEPDLFDAARTFWQRTIEFQFERDSPFSIWGWGQYHANGIPDLSAGRWVVQAGALVARRDRCRLPRQARPARARRADRRDPDRRAALADALVLPLPALVPPVRRPCDRAARRREARRVVTRRFGFVACFVGVAAPRDLAVGAKRSPGVRRQSLPALRRADDARARPLSRLPRRVSAWGAACLRAARAGDRIPTGFAVALAVLLGLAGAVGAILLDRTFPHLGEDPGRRRLARWVVALSPVVLGALLFTRYDLLPAALDRGGAARIPRRPAAARRPRPRACDRGEALSDRAAACRARVGGCDATAAMRPGGSSGSRSASLSPSTSPS